MVAGTVNASQAISLALGTGDVFLQGGTLRTPSLDPLIINVGGNYVQGPFGTLALGVAGIDGKDYDHVQVQGRASLNGTLAVSSLNNFRPSSGNGFEVLLSNGFNEQGSLIPLQIHSDSEDSLRTDLGLRASYTWRIGSVLMIPSVTAFLGT